MMGLANWSAFFMDGLPQKIKGIVGILSQFLHYSVPDKFLYLYSDVRKMRLLFRLLT